MAIKKLINIRSLSLYLKPVYKYIYIYKKKKLKVKSQVEVLAFGAYVFES